MASGKTKSPARIQVHLSGQRSDPRAVTEGTHKLILCTSQFVQRITFFCYGHAPNPTASGREVEADRRVGYEGDEEREYTLLVPLQPPARLCPSYADFFNPDLRRFFGPNHLKFPCDIDAQVLLRLGCLPKR